MKKLLIVLVILGVLLALVIAGLLYADVQVRELAEAEAESRLAKAIPQAKGTDIEIDAFPFVAGVLVGGNVDQLTVRVDELSSSGVEVRDIELEVNDIEIDRDLLLDEQKLGITGISGARIAGSIAANDAARILKAPIKVKDGKFHVTHKGRTYEASLSVNRHVVIVSVSGLPPMLMPLPEHEYLPCEPEVDVVGDHLEIACLVDELPPAVAKVLGKGVG